MKIRSLILSQPLFFIYIRRLLAGRQEHTKNFVKENIKKYNVSSVIDIGCGTGEFIEAIPNSVGYVGIDSNRNYIDYAKKNYNRENSAFLLQDVTDKKFYNKKLFDASILISMLHHLSNKELSEILPIVKKITRKVVIVADIIPDPPTLFGRIIVKLDQGKFVRSREEKLKILEKHFKILDVKLIPSKFAVQMGIICKV